jgi:hypothetical protein
MGHQGHYLGRLNFEKIKVMWRILLIFLDGILAQKTLIYIAADTLYSDFVLRI